MNNYSLSELFGEKKEIKELFFEFMKEQFSRFIETLSVEERDAYCEKTGDSKNGFYERKFETMFGKIEDVKVPRTRRGGFYPSFLERYHRKTFELEEIVISMYQGGCSTRDIAKMLNGLLGESYSPWMVSRITNNVIDLLKEYHERIFDKWYPVLYIDGTFLKLRREIVFKEVVYTVMGITEDGHKEILDFHLMGGGGESSINWQEILSKLRERGLDAPLLVVGDGLRGLREAVMVVYPEADFQLCMLHKVKSSLAKVKKRDETAVAEDMKDIYFQQDKEHFIEKFNVFKRKWQKRYPELIKSWEEDLEILMTYLDYPYLLQQYIYTTNPLERFNKEIKRRSKVIEVFNNKQALEKIVFLVILDMNDSYKRRKLKYWDRIIEELKKKKEKKYRLQEVNNFTQN